MAPRGHRTAPPVGVGHRGRRPGRGFRPHFRRGRCRGEEVRRIVLGPERTGQRGGEHRPRGGLRHVRTAASTDERKQFPAVLRRASQEEIRRANELRRTEETDRQRIVAKVREHKLEMKVSDVEWQWDRHQMTVFFSAEQRVDFRALVRELASAFRTRIDLRQIGVRDEAARIGGVGRCGREYCCSTWLPELSPVNLSLAKNQSLSLNPSQISGGCGRLLCCLKYEHEFYVTSRKRFPREGKTVETLRGTEKVIAVDIFRERVYLRGADESRTIGLEELREEMEGASGGAVIVAPPARRVERPEPRSRPERDRTPAAGTPRRATADRPRAERPRARTASRASGFSTEPHPAPPPGGQRPEAARPVAQEASPSSSPPGWRRRCRREHQPERTRDRVTSFFITTAIDYANGDPHLGHAFEKVGADCIARYRRLRGDDVWFLIGMDEHGQKVAQAAAADGVTPQAFVDRIAGRFEATWDRLSVSRDQFIRTTSPAHQAGVQELHRADLRAQSRRFLRAILLGALLRRAARHSSSRRRSSTGSASCIPRARSRWSRSGTGSFACRATRISSVGSSRRTRISSSRRAAGTRSSACSTRAWRMYRRAGRASAGACPSRGPRATGSSRRRTCGSTPCPTTGPRRASRAPAPAWPAQLHVVGKDITRFHCVIWPAMLEAAGLPLPGRRLGARLRAARWRALQQERRRQARPGRGDRPLRARCLPLLPAARDPVGRRRQLQLGTVRGAVHLRAGRWAGQPRIALPRHDPQVP